MKRVDWIRVLAVSLAAAAVIMFARAAAEERLRAIAMEQTREADRRVMYAAWRRLATNHTLTFEKWVVFMNDAALPNPPPEWPPR